MVRMPMQVRSNFWLEEDGKVLLSEWRVALLEAVAQTGSIKAAAAQQGVHFRVAWRKLHEMEERLGVKLTEGSAGGPHGGGTRLTAEGQLYVRKFRTFMTGLKEMAHKQFQETFGLE
jgi:molybdate transport system regulatory protein